eukprot:9665274-Ditylum_brightwellii.AAC.1
MTGFDLHVHQCRHQHKQDMQAVAFSSDPDESWTTKGKLYKMNNTSKREKEKWPHTGHWKFVLFTAEVTAPDYHENISFHCWLLTITASDASMQLFSSVNVDPDDVYYFCTSKANYKEALMWIDALPELLRQQFSFDDQSLIHDSDDPNQGPTRAYRDEAAENTDEAIQGFASVIDEDMDMADDDANEIKAVEEDSLANCWTALLRSVYSRFSKVVASSS